MSDRESRVEAAKVTLWRVPGGLWSEKQWNIGAGPGVEVAEYVPLAEVQELRGVLEEAFDPAEELEDIAGNLSVSSSPEVLEGAVTSLLEIAARMTRARSALSTGEE